jgi:hypothetical protein
MASEEFKSRKEKKHGGVSAAMSLEFGEWQRCQAGILRSAAGSCVVFPSEFVCVLAGGRGRRR